jgi:hypothetical protein
MKTGNVVNKFMDNYAQNKLRQRDQKIFSDGATSNIDCHEEIEPVVEIPNESTNRS